jgi:hypothetical protein
VRLRRIRPSAGGTVLARASTRALNAYRMDLRGPVREEGLMALINEHNRKWRTVATMALTTLLITIDFNGLAVASPTIGKDLDMSTTGLQCGR